MKTTTTILGVILFASFIFSRCGNNPENNRTPATEKDKQALLEQEYLGNYQGIQPRSYDFKLLLKENGEYYFKQTYFEGPNQSRSSSGKYKIINDAKDILKLECSDFILVINKSDKTAIGVVNNGAEFKLKK